MISFILNWIVSAVALLVTAYIMPGFEVKNFWSALLAAIIIGFVNVLVRPLLLFLTLPINILTLGLFTFILNAAMLKFAAFLTPGFAIHSWFSAIFGAIILSFVGSLLYWLLQVV